MGFLWDHWTVWELGLHHSRKFLSRQRKRKPARRWLVSFLWSKTLKYFPHFYPDKFYNDSQIEEKCQISLLLNHSAKTIQSPTMEQPRHLSAKPGIPQFFPSWAPLSSTFPLGGQFSWHLSASPQPTIFWLGGNFSVSFNQAPDLRTWRDLPKFICTPQGGEWAQGVTAGTKAPVPRGVQSKKGSPLWVPSWSP